MNGGRRGVVRNQVSKPMTRTHTGRPRKNGGPDSEKTTENRGGNRTGTAAHVPRAREARPEGVGPRDNEILVVALLAARHDRDPAEVWRDLDRFKRRERSARADEQASLVEVGR